MSAVESCRAQLRAIATDLRASVAESLNPDEQAYAALVQDGELHPWTEQAHATWTQARGPDPWRHHHLAILHHARAYDLEMAGSPEASHCWTAALRHWAAVHADDAFWARMTRHLGEHMGAGIDPNVVAGVRDRLPRDLLEPHRDLIAVYQSSDPERARSHMRVVKSAPFDPDTIDGVRVGFVREVVAAVPDTVNTADFEAMIAELRRWLDIDEDNAHLVQAFLYVYRKFDEHVWNADDGLARVARNVTEVGQVVGPILETIRAPRNPDPAGVAGYVERLEALRPRGRPQGALRAEIARNEFWSGWVSMRLSEERLSWEPSQEAAREREGSASKAVTHLALARLIDPQLALDRYYQNVTAFEGTAEALWGLSLLSSQRQGGSDLVGAAQHLRRAITLDPSDVRSLHGLAQALLTSDDVSDAALAEAEHALSQAVARAGESDAVTELRKLLALRRALKLGRPGSQYLT